jgi:hypothetical protein
MEPKKTKSGRLVKTPERYTPIEKVEDDYSSDEYDSDDEVPSSVYSSDEEDEEDSESDTEGSLKDFIVPDESDSDSDS